MGRRFRIAVPADHPSSIAFQTGRRIAAVLSAWLLLVSTLHAEPASHRGKPFETVTRPAVPTPPSPPLAKGGIEGGWIRNPIDAFLAAEYAERGLKPRPEASRNVLLRRVYLDLIGLPPTREELQAFLADQSPDAYEKVVDKLLASPQYGERWGRHWMDIWRYSDWAGYGNEVRDSQMHIWRWRDWIVESLNANKGYDRMILEMLAGDELAPDDPNTLRATGFLARNWYKFNRQVWLQNTVEHTSKAFLGITMNCARCHDHFFDPISHKEYYEFRAFFEPHDVRTDRVPGQPDLTKDGLPRVYDAQPNALTYLFLRGEEHKPDKSKSLSPGVPAALGGSKLRIEPVKLPPAAYLPDKREFVIQETLAASRNNINTAHKTLEAARQNAVVILAQAALDDPWRSAAKLAGVQKALDAQDLAEVNAPLAEASLAALEAVLRVEKLEDAGKKDTGAGEWKQAATETATLQRKLALLTARRDVLAARQARRNAPEKTRPETDKKVAAAEQALAKAETDLKLPATTAYTKRNLTTYPATSTGRRLALARWIADPRNPLTARVAVNHIWLRHFGKPLVPTVFDFGNNGQPASHPALLDWLATEFMTPSPQPSPPAGERVKKVHPLPRGGRGGGA